MYYRPITQKKSECIYLIYTNQNIQGTTPSNFESLQLHEVLSVNYAKWIKQTIYFIKNKNDKW